MHNLWGNRHRAKDGNEQRENSETNSGCSEEGKMITKEEMLKRIKWAIRQHEEGAITLVELYNFIIHTAVSLTDPSQDD